MLPDTHYSNANAVTSEEIPVCTRPVSTSLSVKKFRIRNSEEKMLDDDFAEEYADDDAPSGDEYVVADDAAVPQTVDAAAETDAVFALPAGRVDNVHDAEEMLVVELRDGVALGAEVVEHQDDVSSRRRLNCPGLNGHQRPVDADGVHSASFTAPKKNEDFEITLLVELVHVVLQLLLWAC